MFEKIKRLRQAIGHARALNKGTMTADEVTEAIMREAGFDPEPEAQIDLSEPAIQALLAPEHETLYPGAPPALSAENLALIKAMRLSWNGAESGAPEQNMMRPFTSGGTLDALAAQLGAGVDEDAQVAFLLGRVQALCTYCEKADLAAGPYRISNLDYADLAEAMSGLDDWQALVGVGEDMVIELTADDITLARNSQWDWPDEDDMHDALARGEIAGPTVDPKRPYGDMSFIALDIHRLLDWPIEARNEDGYIELTDAQIDEGQRLHFRQLCVMQAFLEHGQMPVAEEDA